MTVPQSKLTGPILMINKPAKVFKACTVYYIPNKSLYNALDNDDVSDSRVHNGLALWLGSSLHLRYIVHFVACHPSGMLAQVLITSTLRGTRFITILLISFNLLPLLMQMKAVEIKLQVQIWMLKSYEPLLARSTSSHSYMQINNPSTSFVSISSSGSR